MIEKLLEDMSFKLLEREYVKRAKKRDEGGLGAKEYELYLTALVQRILDLCGEGRQEPGRSGEKAVIVPFSVPQGVSPRRGRPPKPKLETEAKKPGKFGNLTARDLEAPSGQAKGKEVIPRGKQVPPWVAMRDEVVELCAKHKEPAFIAYFDETFPVNDIHDWLRDVGSKWGVEKIDPLSMRLSEGVGDVARKGNADTEAEVKASDKWTVHFRRG